MGEQGDTILEAHGLHKAYGSTLALQGVDLSMGAGEFVVLLGPNGAGKSTLFQILSGLFVPDQGQLQLLGTDLRRQPARALAALGVVFQQPTLDLDLSVAANLRFHARLHGMGAKGGPRIREELTRLDLATDADKPCRALSGGNRRRVELARSLLHRPRLLLMDEATVGLDHAARHRLLDYVLSLCRDRGLAVLWATHLVDEAAAASRIVVLHRGRVRFDGAPGELIQGSGAGDLGAAFLNITRSVNQPGGREGMREET